MKTITKHYIDRAFVDSHGHEVMEIVKRLMAEWSSAYRRRSFQVRRLTGLRY